MTTVPDLEARPGIVASASALREGGRTLEHVEDAFHIGRAESWLRLEPYVSTRGDGLVLDCAPEPFREQAMTLRTPDGASIRIPATIAPDHDPVEASLRVLTTLRVALAAATRRAPSAWTPPPWIVRDLHDAFVEQRHHSVRIVHPGPLCRSSVNTTILTRRTESHLRLVRPILYAIPPRPCRIICRSRHGRSASACDRIPAIEIHEHTTWIALDPLTPIERLRLEARVAKTRR